MFPINYSNHQTIDRIKTINTHITKPSNIQNLVNNKSTNYEVDLIDFLDNIHIKQESQDNDKKKQITDLQIKMLEEFCTTSVPIHKPTAIQDEEFRLFLDKYEYGKSKIPTAKLEHEDIIALEQKPAIEDRLDKASGYFYDETPKVLIPRLKQPSEPESLDVEANVDEDLIEEVLFEQQLERQLLATGNPTNEELKKQTNAKLLNANQISRDTKSSREYNIFDEIVNKNKVSFVRSTQNIPKTNEAKHVQATNTKCTNYLNSTANSNQKAYINELVTKYDIKYLEAIKKVEKIFQKRNNLKSDVEKSKLTPGPSLYEKSVFLPQIMHSLNEKQKRLDSKSMMKMRLVLDSGSSCSHLENNNQSNKSRSKSLNSSSVDCNLNNNLRSPQVLMADCNKERFKAFETAKRFNNFVCNGSFYAP